VISDDRPPSAGTQCSRILQVLVDARGAWVPLPSITKLAAQYSARIWTLRRDGHAIENRTQMIDGERHSWFRLPVPPPKPIAITGVRPTPETLPLFGKEVR
jgi:hypothetical protein